MKMKVPCQPGWFLVVASVLLGFGGCGKSEPALDPTALPEVEPTVADQPDPKAASSFREVAVNSGSTDWPQLFGPNRTSSVQAAINPVWSEEGPTEVWSIDVGTGYGSPVVSQNRVVFSHRIGDEEVVVCVDATSGDPIWQHRYPTDFECDVEYSNGPYSTPAISEDEVFVAGGQGQFFCLDFQTGKPKWSRDLKKDYQLEDDIFPMGSAPGVTKDQVIYNVGASGKDAGIIAMNRQTGETIWEVTDQDAAYCSPFFAMIHDQPFVFVVTHQGLVSVNPETGEEDWSIEHRCRAPMSYNSVSPLVLDDKVLVVTGPGPGALCVQVNPDRSYREVWKNRRVIDSQYNTLLLSEGHVFGFTASGQGGAELRCVDFQTGELNWKYHSVLRRGQGIIVGKAMILLGEKGHLASLVVDTSEPKVLSFTSSPIMSEPCYCTPAYSDGYLYLKDERRVACFSLQ